MTKRDRRKLLLARSTRTEEILQQNNKYQSDIDARAKARDVAKMPDRRREKLQRKILAKPYIDPNFVPDPNRPVLRPIITPPLFDDEFYKYFEEHKINYGEVIKSCQYIIKPTPQAIHINIFLAVKGREEHLKTCLRYLKASLKNSPINYRVTILENDSTPLHKNIAEANNCDHLFIPLSASNSNNLIAKSLLWNVGFILAPKTDWYLLYDIDMLVDDNFFVILNSYLKDMKDGFIQPYQKRRTLNITPESSAFMMNCNRIINFGDITCEAALPGSTGGILGVHHDSFINAGGFDPELFYGYAHEDSAFWLKLECIHPEIIYANNPPIDIYHLWHTHQKSMNQNFSMLERLYRTLFLWEQENKMKYIELKRNILMEAINGSRIA